MPGYWVCLLVTVAVIAPIGALVGGTAVTAGDGLRYLSGNAWLVHREPFIGELFATNPFALTVNGSLWTLAPEVACYVGILCVPRRLLKLLAPGLVVGIGLVHAARMTGLAPTVIAVDFPLAFALGGGAWLFRDRLQIHWALALGALVGAFGALMAGAFIAVGIPFIAYLVLWLAVTIRRPVRTDLSYGVYIYAFPLQQLAAAFGLHTFGFVPFLALGAAASLGAAAVSWHLVERPALALKRFRRPGRGTMATAPVIARDAVLEPGAGPGGG
jgi:hypothetical protein